MLVSWYEFYWTHDGPFADAFSHCHPEALLLREGSPAMCRTELRFPGSWPTKHRFSGESQATAFQPEAFREILRPKAGLQDDR